MELPLIDVVVLVAYVLAVVVLGCWFVRRGGSTEEFTAAGRSLPGWVVGLSIFGTYLSSNTFLGVPGKAFGDNWNFFVFSLSLPVAALIAVRWFVPFYRRTGEVSAYHHFERRFGAWARTYAVVCYLLTQLARVGSILFGVGIALKALLGWDIAAIIVSTGALVTLYTLLGGISAVIWTDVVQSVVLTTGALAAAALLVFGMPGGPAEVFEVAAAGGKFSLGSFGPSLGDSTFWVVLLYGLFINLNNFGIDQNFVQRYHTAKSSRDAARSVWLGAVSYVPVSALFFFIGTALFSYYQKSPGMLDDVRAEVAAQQLAGEGITRDVPDWNERLDRKAADLSDAEVGDRVFPHFIAHRLPSGFAGLLIAALFAAAMSSVDSSLNSSVTVFLSDIYRRYIRSDAGEKESLRVLHAGTVVSGLAGTGVALAMIGVESVLAAWWELQGIFAGGLLGLFLLGLISRRAGSPAALTAVAVGVLVILWMTFSPRLEGDLEFLRSPFHNNLIIVIGTLTIFLVGLAVGRWRGARSADG